METKKASKRRRRRWTPEEQRGLLQEASRLMASGASWDAAAKAVGVWPSSLRRWREDAERAAFKEVVVPPVLATSPVPSPEGGVVITTPDGIRVAGLDVDGACLILEMLRC